MGDIAGLLALMQGNKGMDLPGLLALCKEKGYDRGWGGEGMHYTPTRTAASGGASA